MDDRQTSGLQPGREPTGLSSTEGTGSMATTDEQERGNMMDQARAMARNMGGQARSAAANAGVMAHDMAQRAREVTGADRAGEYLSRNVNEYPLAALLLAGALGYGMAFLIHTKWSSGD